MSDILREIHIGDPVRITVYLLGADEKRIHTFEELRHATEGWLYLSKKKKKNKKKKKKKNKKKKNKKKK